MVTEIERKFLVINASWREQVHEQKQIAQGYLNTNPERTVRVRISDQTGIITIKGKPDGLSRAEFEYEIPLIDAQALIQLCERPIIEKTRNLAIFENKLWEIDEFAGDNQGLIIAEVELSSKNELVTLPSWVGKDVSAERKYFNSSLISHPYKCWGQNQ